MALFGWRRYLAGLGVFIWVACDAGYVPQSSSEDIDGAVMAGAPAPFINAESAAGGMPGPKALLFGDPAPTIVSASAEGPYRVDGYGVGGDLSFGGGTVWHPVDANGLLPLVAVVPGFISPEFTISDWGPFLASHGMAVITIDTNSGLDLPAQRRAALFGALDVLSRENTRLLSPMIGRLDLSRRAVMGWSMGGGGALEAATQDPSLRAAISMAGWNVLYSYAFNRVPSLMFASLGDPLAGGMSQGFYNSIPAGTPKMLIEWPGSDHFVANDPSNRLGVVGRYGLSWLKVYLQGDERYRQFLVEPLGTTDFRTNLDGLLVGLSL